MKLLISLFVALVLLLTVRPVHSQNPLDFEKRGITAAEQYRSAKKRELDQRMVERSAMKKAPKFTGEKSTTDHFAMSGKNNEHREFVTTDKKSLQEALAKNKEKIERLRADIDSAPSWMVPPIKLEEGVTIPCFGEIQNTIVVFQITSSSRFIGKAGGSMFIFEGFDTSKFADGESLGLKQPIKILETETYTTVTGGSKTVYKIVPLSANEQNTIVECTTKKREAFKGESFRTWTDSTKKFSVKAWFIEREKADVVLKKEDGEIVKLPLAKLSLQDKTWIRDWEL